MTPEPGCLTPHGPQSLSQLTFTGKSEDKEYVADLEFHKPVNPDAEGTVWKVGFCDDPRASLDRVASACGRAPGRSATHTTHRFGRCYHGPYR